jgi:hypothetical protein
MEAKDVNEIQVLLFRMSITQSTVNIEWKPILNCVHFYFFSKFHILHFHVGLTLASPFSD